MTSNADGINSARGMTERERLLHDDLSKRFRHVLSVFEHLTWCSRGVFGATFVTLWDIAREVTPGWEFHGPAPLGGFTRAIHGLRIAKFLVDDYVSTSVVGGKL